MKLDFNKYTEGIVMKNEPIMICRITKESFYLTEQDVIQMLKKHYRRK